MKFQRLFFPFFLLLFGCSNGPFIVKLSLLPKTNILYVRPFIVPAYEKRERATDINYVYVASGKPVTYTFNDSDFELLKQSIILSLEKSHSFSGIQ